MGVASEINGSSLKRLAINLGSKVQPMLQLHKPASYCFTYQPIVKVGPRQLSSNGHYSGDFEVI